MDRYIHKSVKIGKNVELGRFIIIEEGCEIGDNTFIGDFVKMRPNTKIGRHCVICNFVGFEPSVTIGDHVSIREMSLIGARTVIEDLVFIAAGVMMVNDKKISWQRPQIEIPKEGPMIRRGARIGVSAVILPGIEIGENAVVGAGSVVYKNVPPRSVVMAPGAKLSFRVPDEEIV